MALSLGQMGARYDSVVANDARFWPLSTPTRLTPGRVFYARQLVALSWPDPPSHRTWPACSVTMTDRNRPFPVSRARYKLVKTHRTATLMSVEIAATIRTSATRI